VTPAIAHVVTVGAALAADPEGAAVAAVLARAGILVASRVLVEDDEAALQRALGPDGALTVILAGAGSSAGDVVRRVLSRAVGARLVLNQRMLDALAERFRRIDRPLPRRADRLALLPQGATVWIPGEGEPAWALESGARRFVVLPRDGFGAALEEHLVPLAREYATGRGAVVTRVLRTAGVGAGELEERLAEWIGQPERGDMVVFNPSTDSTIPFVKRIVAVGGDVVEVRDGQLFVNGEPSEIDEARGSTLPQSPQVVYPYTVPEGEFFAMGDNRTASSDSRSFGSQQNDRIIGKVLLRFWPLDRLSFFEW